MTMAWHALTIQPCRERLAQRHLTLRGFEAFYPMLVHRRFARGRKFETEGPLFPGYAFCLVGDDRRGVEDAPGVLGFVGIVPARVIQNLISLEPTQPAEAQVAVLLVGSNVRIRVGPLTGFVATIARKHNERVKLLVSMFNSDNTTDWLPASWVEAVSAEDEAA